MKPLFLLLAICLGLSACDKPTQSSSEDLSVAGTTEKPASIDGDSETTDKPDSAESEFEWSPERFADVQIIRYQIPGFDELKPRQKALVYYLVQAGLAGRDILWDQNYRHNLSIRRALEAIMSGEQGTGDEWDALSSYARCGRSDV